MNIIIERKILLVFLEKPNVRIKMIKKNIPNALTLLNAVCGFCATIYILKDEFLIAFLFIIGALIADFLDGFVARLLKVQSEIGGQLDSLADAISFGVVPAVIAREVLIHNVHNYDLEIPFTLFAACIAAFSVLRLARFNIEKTDANFFMGLNTPTNTIFWMGVAIAQANSFSIIGTLTNSASAVSVTIVLSCYLLVSRIKMFSLKNFRGLLRNRWFWIFVIGALACAFFATSDALVFAVVLYVLVNLGHNVFVKKMNSNAAM